MNPDPNVHLRQENALNYLQIALYELTDLFKTDEDYKNLVDDLGLFKRPIEEIISKLEKLKL